ncbi:Ras-related protein Rac [Acrasis kona]|uniref:Ras-related protein Rac n=1 Tax=Acrasis kona TaxID=1008807 RepID=A0AAW2Z4B4_9EUKA
MLIKIVVVGDGAVGKTCMLLTYSSDEFPEEYVPTVFDNFQTNVKHEGEDITVSLWDTAGQEDYDRLRPLSYPNTDVFLVCFSTVIPTSLDHVRTRWAKELEKHASYAVKILVGTQSDLKEDFEMKQKARLGGYEFPSIEEAESCAKYINAISYMECSAKNRVGVKEIITASINATLQRKRVVVERKKTVCVLL